jgi:hypothetical protein
MFKITIGHDISGNVLWFYDGCFHDVSGINHYQASLVLRFLSLDECQYFNIFLVWLSWFSRFDFNAIWICDNFPFSFVLSRWTWSFCTIITKVDGIHINEVTIPLHYAFQFIFPIVFKKLTIWLDHVFMFACRKIFNGFKGLQVHTC